MNTTPDTLTERLIELLRAGCQVEITPLQSPYGFLYAQVRIIPPASHDPQAPIAEWQKLKNGNAIALPFRTEIALLYYKTGSLEGILADARLLYIRKP